MMRHMSRGEQSGRQPESLLGHWAVVVACGLVFGCGPGGPAVQMVKGSVTLDGSPLGDADIGFVPAVAGRGLPAVGRTASDGSFVLNAQGAYPGRGTLAGDYVVTVRKTEAVTPSGPVGPISTDDPDYGKVLPDITDRGASSQSLVPEAYGDSARSPLRASVVTGQNVFRFELESAAR